MKITADFDKTVGKIKPMHGVGQPPFTGVDFGMFEHLKDAGIPYSRLHDVGGAYGGYRWVDIPNLFRDFSADETKEESYDFTYTDLLISALVENGVEPFFRLGVTIENQAMIKAYRIDPPADYGKWARICEHIIRHYTEGWANGFNYKIEYWEIWNEPDNFEPINENQMWRGTKEQYYELYDVASKHLKSCFPHLKIGGYASCGFYAINKSFVKSAKSSPRMEYFIEFFDGFLDYVKANGCPLDFFSWHSYDEIEANRAYCSYAKKRLTDAGYGDIHVSCNEWNCHVNERGTYKHAALTAGMMLMFQDAPLDSAMFYDARYGIGIYGSLFNPLDQSPFPSYYAFKAYNELYKLGEQILLKSEEDGIYAVAAKKGENGCIVIANTTDKDIPLELEGCGRICDCLLTANGENEKTTVLPKIIAKESILVIRTELS